MNKKLETIKIKNENGSEKELAIYLTYHSDDFNKDYVVFYEIDNPDHLIAAEYDEEGYLSDIESEKEYDELDRIIAEYQENKQD